MSKGAKIAIAVGATIVVVGIIVAIFLLVVFPQETNDDNVIVNPDVIVYEEGESSFTILSSSDASITVDTASGISVGSIIASDVTSTAPSGLLRRVTAIRQNADGSTVLETRPAALTEAIEYCDVHQTITLNDNGTYTLEQDGTGGNVPFVVEKAYADSLDNLFNAEVGAVNCSGGVQIELDLEIDRGRIDMELCLHLQSEMDLGSLNCSFSKDLFELSKACTFCVGPVPIVLDHQFSVGLEGSVKFQGITTDISVIFDRKVGFNYSSEKGLSPVDEDHSHVENNTAYSDDVVNFAEYQLSLPIEYGAFIYGLAGPTINASVDVDLQELLKTLPVEDQDSQAISVPGSNRKYSGEYLFKVTLPISGHFKLKIPDINPFSDDDLELADFELFNTSDLITLINEYRTYGTAPDKPVIAISDFSSDLAQSATSNAGGVDIMLVLDTSSSMGGDPIEAAIDAANGFIDETAGDKTRVGLVTYGDDAELLSLLTNDTRELKGLTADINVSGGTNIEAGMKTAFDTLRLSDASKKVIVLMSDGEPNAGLTDEDLIDYVASEKGNPTDSDSVKVYTLGFNESPEGAALLRALSDEGRQYEIEDSADLQPFFVDVADEINGVRYLYSKIACPVEVKVVYEGETLDSATQSNRTSFGTISYEDELNSDGEVVNEKGIKILRLREGANYDIELTGTGNGVMTYTVACMDDDGNYSDVRLFPNIPVSPGMKAVGRTDPSDDSVLKVDYDGDGKYEVAYRAEANSEGVLVDNYGVAVLVLWICLGLAVLCAVLIGLQTKKRIMRARQVAKILH